MSLWVADGTDQREAGRAQNRSQMKPRVPATTEAATIAFFDPFTNSSSASNARFAMKMDIVKPMPPRTPAPNT